MLIDENTLINNINEFITFTLIILFNRIIVNKIIFIREKKKTLLLVKSLERIKILLNINNEFLNKAIKLLKNEVKNITFLIKEYKEQNIK